MAAAAKPAAAAAATKAPPYVLRVDLVPPAMYQNANQEQHFTMPYSPADLQPGPPNLAQVVRNVTAASPLVYLGSNIANNPVRLAGIDASGNVLKEARNEAERLKILAARQFEVPPMFHYQQATLIITCLEPSDEPGEADKVHWRKEVVYQLPQKDFPAAKVASTWLGTSLGQLKGLRTIEEMASEPIKFVGREKPIVFVSTDHALVVQFVVQECRNARSGEAMSFYMDRVWSPRKIAVFANQRTLLP